MNDPLQDTMSSCQPALLHRMRLNSREAANGR